MIGRLGDASDRAGNFQSDALVCSTYAVYGQQQGCPPGLFGPGCSPCTLDAECVVETGSELATCNTGFLYDGLSTVKGYRCNPTGPSLVNSLLNPDSVVVQCHTGASQGAGAVGGLWAMARQRHSRPHLPGTVCLVGDFISLPQAQNSTATFHLLCRAPR